VQLPLGYSGALLQKTAADESESSAAALWRLLKRFGSFTYWKHGTDPMLSDSAQRRLEFLSIQAQVMLSA
jgi:hypothetical protein